MRWLRFLLPLLGCWAAAGCTPDDNVTFFQDISRDPGYPGTAGDPASYEHLFTYTPDPNCTPAVPRVLDSSTEVRVFRGNGISMDDVVHFVGGLRRYYDHYGVLVFARHEVISVPLDHALVFNEGAISDKMRELGVNPSCANSSYPSTACEKAMGAALFHNVKGFLKLYAEPKQDLVNIVLVKRIAALDPSPELADSWGIAGLGFSESLVNSRGVSDLGASLATILDETDYSPTIFVGVNLVRFILRHPDIIIAHEFGHAYGLAHVDNERNLMNPEVVNCRQSLDPSQLSVIEKETVRSGNALLAGIYSPREFLSFTHRAPEVMGILRSRIAQHARRGGFAP